MNHDVSSAAGIAWEFQPEGGGWQPIQVPAGGWRTQGYTCDAGTYRAWLPIPAAAAGHVIRLAFAAVNFGAEVAAGPDAAHLTSVTSHINGWLPFHADLTAVAVPGSPLLVQVAVRGRRKFLVNGKYTVAEGADWYPDLADGILRGVALVVLPRVHVHELWIRTRLAPDVLQAQVTVTNAGPQAVTAEVTAQLASWNQSPFSYPLLPAITVALAPGATQVVDWGPLAWPLGPASYWWPNVPYRPGYLAQLHLLNVTVAVAGHPGHTAQQRFGFRQFQARANRYELNGIHCNLRGDNQQEANFGTDGYGVKAGFGPPSASNPGWPQAVDNLLRLNFNVMRIHQIPATPYMLDVCDERGLMLVDESPLRGSGNAEDFVAGHAHMVNGVRELVRRDRHHPAIVLWSAANEWAAPLLDTAKAILELDDTRPIIGDGGDYGSGTNRIAELDPYCIIMQHYVGGMPGLPLLGGTPRPDRPYGETEAVWPHDNTKAGFAWMGTGMRIRRRYGNADLRNYILNNAWPNYVPGESPETLVLEKQVTGTWKGELTIQPALADPWNYPLIQLLQRCCHPLAISDVEFDLVNARSNVHGAWPVVKPLWVAGTPVMRTLAVCNDEFADELVTIRWQVRRGTASGAVLVQGDATQVVPLGEHCQVPLTFTCPPAPGDVVLVLTVAKGGQVRLVEEALAFKIIAAAPARIAAGAYRLTFLFTGKPLTVRETRAHDGDVMLNDVSEDVRPRAAGAPPPAPLPPKGTWQSTVVINDDPAAPAAAHWHVQPADDGTIVLRRSPRGLALAVTSTAEGTPVILEPYVRGKRAQRWRLELVGDACYRLVNDHTGNLLDVYGWVPLPAARVMQRQRLAPAYQLWRLEPVVPPR